MTPSNTQATPEIKKVIDSGGDGHTVIPTPHTHSQSEVSGLADALAAKASASDMTTALSGKADKVSGATNNNLAALDGNGNIKDSGKKASDFADASEVQTALAGKQNTLTFDSTPTTGSTNPVTSGGVKSALDGKQNTLTFDSTPTTGSTNPVTSGGVFSELAKKLSKVEVTDLDDLSEVTDSGLYELCLNTSSTHTTSFEYFLMLVERSLPVITYTLIYSTGYKKRTYHVSNGWVGNDWDEYVYATTEFKPDGIESLSSLGSAKVYTYISDLTGDGRIVIELEDHLGNNVEIEITPENITNLINALQTPDSTPTTNSTKLVTSGGVKTAIDAAKEAVKVQVVDIIQSTEFDVNDMYVGVLYMIITSSNGSTYLHAQFIDSGGNATLYMNQDPLLEHEKIYVIQAVRDVDDAVWVTFNGEYQQHTINSN